MDFSSVVLTEAQQAFAGQVKAFLDEHLTEEVYARRREQAYDFDDGLYRALGCEAWLWPRWRREDGGAELDDVCVRILETERKAREAPLLSGTPLIWPGVEAHARPDLRDELKPQVARGTVRICLGYTEPYGGSDIAGAKTRAVRDGDEWVINGQKIFTTGAQYCQYVFLITRTDPTAQAQGPDHVPGAARHPGHRDPAGPHLRRASGPTSSTTGTSASPTATGSARSTTAGPSCTDR